MYPARREWEDMVGLMQLRTGTYLSRVAPSGSWWPWNRLWWNGTVIANTFDWVRHHARAATAARLTEWYPFAGLLI